MCRRVGAVLSAVRTPTGKFLGPSRASRAPQLGAMVVREAVVRAGIAPDRVDEVILGNVVSAGLGQAPARQAAIHAGLPPKVAALTINKVCGSGPEGRDARGAGDRRRATPTSSWRAAWSPCPTAPTSCPKPARGCASAHGAARSTR